MQYADLLCVQQPAAAAPSTRLSASRCPTTQVLKSAATSLLRLQQWYQCSLKMLAWLKRIGMAYMSGHVYADLQCVQHAISAIPIPRLSAPRRSATKVLHQLLRLSYIYCFFKF